MDHGKDKTITYGRFGKANSKIQKDMPLGRGEPRKSQGNIYDDIVEQMEPGHKKYVKQLVRRNQVNPITPNLNRDDSPFFTGKIQTPIIQTNLQQANCQYKLNREKGNTPADFITPLQPRKPKIEEQGQQKVGVFKPSFQREYFSYQVTPKNHSQSNKGFTKMEERKELDTFADKLNEFALDDVRYEKKETEACRNFKSEETFLENLDSYMVVLKMKTSESETNGRKKLNNTIKFSQENCKLASKLESSIMKIKELKLKNHLLEKQQSRQARKQQKMKSNIYQMMGEIRYLNESLAKQKKQKRNLQKIINNFEANVRRCKPERKTIGKGIKQLISDGFDSRIYHQVTENDSEMQDLNEISQFNSSYQWKSRTKVGKNPFQDKHDEEKTDQLFDYHDVSQDESQND